MRTLPAQTGKTQHENITTFYYQGGLELQVARFYLFPPEDGQSPTPGCHRDGEPIGSAIVYRVAPGLEGRDGLPVRRVIGRAALDRVAGRLVLRLPYERGGQAVGTLDAEAVSAEVAQAIWAVQPAPRWWERWGARLAGRVA